MGTHPQINIQLIEENVPAAADQLWELAEARQLAQEWLQTIQKAKDNKIPWNPWRKMMEKLKKGDKCG
jgi:hypothetical protein